MSKYLKSTVRLVYFNDGETAEQIEDMLNNQDWEVVSHSHSPYGMTVMLRGNVLTEIDDRANTTPKSKLAQDPNN